MCEDVPLFTEVVQPDPPPPPPPHTHTHTYVAAAACLQRMNSNLPCRLAMHEHLKRQGRLPGVFPFQSLPWPREQ